MKSKFFNVFKCLLLENDFRFWTRIRRKRRQILRKVEENKDEKKVNTKATIIKMLRYAKQKCTSEFNYRLIQTVLILFSKSFRTVFLADKFGFDYRRCHCSPFDERKNKWKQFNQDELEFNTTMYS